MERGSSKHGPRIDDDLSDESQPIERSAKETRADEAREDERVGREDAERPGTARGTDRDTHLAGSQSSADVYPHQEHDEGGASHPKPQDDDEAKDEDETDEASKESFPASDPPAW